MIKMKKSKDFKTRSKFHPWLMNKIKFIRQKGKPLAARASRWGGPSGVALIIFLLIGSFLYPKNELQILKWRLLQNPNDFQAHLALAEKLLDNNQFQEAEQTLLVAQQIKILGDKDTKILGEKTNSKISELWQREYYSNPEDIQRLIEAWEKIVQEKPNYRDGYLQLAILHYKIYENEKAKEYLNKALEIDPNYQLTRELEKILK